MNEQPKRYELIDKDGNAVRGIYFKATTAAMEARRRWPDQSQDPDRIGQGWDVQECPKKS